MENWIVFLQEPKRKLKDLGSDASFHGQTTDATCCSNIQSVINNCFFAPRSGDQLFDEIGVRLHCLFAVRVPGGSMALERISGENKT